MNPVCYDCCKIMDVIKTGIRISTSSIKDIVYKIYSGDVFYCMNCGLAIYGSFGDPYERKATEVDVDDIIFVEH